MLHKKSDKKCYHLLAIGFDRSLEPKLSHLNSLNIQSRFVLLDPDLYFAFSMQHIP